MLRLTSKSQDYISWKFFLSPFKPHLATIITSVIVYVLGEMITRNIFPSA